MIDVIVPVKSTNKNFSQNIGLLSQFSWVKKIILGDSGMHEDVLADVIKLEKVEIIDQKNIYSQGKCITELAEATTTEYFAYFHGDVTVPEEWFEIMKNEIQDSAILECLRIYQYDICYTQAENKNQLGYRRPLSGTQLISKNKFLECTQNVHDDFLFRNEDLVFASLVQQAGYKYSKTEKTHHVHQIGFDRQNENVSYKNKVRLISEPSISDLKMFKNQLFGLIKYSSHKDVHCRSNFDLAYTVYIKLGGNKDDLCKFIHQYTGWNIYFRLLRIRMSIRKLKLAIKILKSSDYGYYFRN